MDHRTKLAELEQTIYDEKNTNGVQAVLEHCLITLEVERDLLETIDSSGVDRVQGRIAHIRSLLNTIENGPIKI